MCLLLWCFIMSVISVFLILCICFFNFSVYVFVLFLWALLPDSNKWWWWWHREYSRRPQLLEARCAGHCRPDVRRVWAGAEPQRSAFRGGAYRGGLPPTACYKCYHNHSYIIDIAISFIYLLHCVLSLVVQCIVIGPVCGFVYVCVCLRVCLWVCYHDNSKLRASILTKLGL